MNVSRFAIGILLFPAIAHADDSPAERLFQEGMRLIDAGKIGDGCEKLSESYRLDPGFGVLFNLADCHERVGRTATAHREFREASVLASRAGQAERQTKADKRVRALEGRLVHVTIHVDAQAGTAVLFDGAPLSQELWDRPLPVDPGAHRLEASAPAKKPWKSAIELGTAGSFVTATVPPLESDGAGWDRSANPSASVSHPGLGTQRSLALGVGGIGLASLGVGTAMSFVAKSTYDSSNCQGNSCQQPGLDARSRAFTQAAVATGLFIGAGVALAGAGLLWFTAPKTKTKVGVSGAGAFVSQSW